jgi:hypothetical protein
MYRINKCVSDLGTYPIDMVYNSLQYKGISADLIIYTVQNILEKDVKDDVLCKKIVCKMVADYRAEGIPLNVTHAASRIGITREYFYENVRNFSKDIAGRASKEAAMLSKCKKTLNKNLYANEQQR